MSERAGRIRIDRALVLLEAYPEECATRRRAISVRLANTRATIAVVRVSEFVLEIYQLYLKYTFRLRH